MYFYELILRSSKKVDFLICKIFPWVLHQDGISFACQFLNITIVLRCIFDRRQLIRCNLAPCFQLETRFLHCILLCNGCLIFDLTHTKKAERRTSKLGLMAQWFCFLWCWKWKFKTLFKSFSGVIAYEYFLKSFCMYSIKTCWWRILWFANFIVLYITLTGLKGLSDEMLILNQGGCA